MKKKLFAAGCYLLLSLLLINGSNAQWISQNSGTSNDLYSICGLDENNIYIWGNNNVLLKTTNGGNNWTVINTGITYPLVRCHFININTGWASLHKIYKTTNGGLNWTMQTNYDSTYSFTWFYFINEQTGWITCSRYIMPAQGGILYTTNGGTNWLWILNTSDWLNCIQFMNTQIGYASGVYQFYKTTNGGINWNISSNASGVRMHFPSTDTGWIAQSTIYRTTNGGENWTYQPSGAISQFSGIKFLNNSTGYAICYYDIFKTTNGGNSWDKIFTDTSHRYNDLYFFNVNTGWVISRGGIILKTSTGGNTNVKNINSDQPASFSLNQNYPNPFNSVTKIQFDVPEKGNVKIVVYDISGKELNVILNERLQPGKYEVEWNASQYSSGMYFYRMQTENYIVTRKMILIK
jgi:photosystem II stability/assembly factor-like uncharacterized protein